MKQENELNPHNELNDQVYRFRRVVDRWSVLDSLLGGLNCGARGSCRILWFSREAEGSRLAKIADVRVGVGDKWWVAEDGQSGTYILCLWTRYFEARASSYVKWKRSRSTRIQ